MVMGEYRILVVDDQPANIDLVMEMLKETGEPYVFFQAHDGESARRMAEKEQPDLIFTDWEIKATPGIEVIGKLKSHESTRDIPVIIAAGATTTPDDLFSAIEAGAMDYIRKPLGEVELVVRVRAALLLGESYKETKRKKEELEKLNETLFLLNETLEEKNRKLYESVITDSLTLIYNREFLMESLSKEYSKSKRHGLVFSCIMIDIDHFKSVNDDHGHQAGDYVLRTIAAHIKESIRHEDILGRYGGEEFLLILPNSTEKDSMMVAEKIRVNIENTIYDYDGLKLKINLSLGVADNRTGGPKNVDQLIFHADKALYQSKRTGRNKTVSYTQLHHPLPSE
ncbi:MAG: diguanylate cyclase [bacterium]|nr:diguanylate cyclase [bacterium]